MAHFFENIRDWLAVRRLQADYKRKNDKREHFPLFLTPSKNNLLLHLILDRTYANRQNDYRPSTTRYSDIPIKMFPKNRLFINLMSPFTDTKNGTKI